MLNAEEILNNFIIYGDFVSIKNFGSGHINDTYLVNFSQDGKSVNYILRRINDYVFRNPELIVENTVKVTDHIRSKIKEKNVNDIGRRVLTLLQTKSKKYFYIDENNSTWCLLLFIENSYSINSVISTDQAYEAGKAYGKFQVYLSDFEASNCHITINDFHNLERRIKNFKQSYNRNNRRANVKDLVLKIDKNIYLVDKYLDIKKRNLPTRITHNDTKINNILFDKETNEGICIVDLDTVMPGIVLNDFGDMVRTFTSPVFEDGKDLTKVELRLEIFDALTKGFLSELKENLTQDEKDNLVLGSKIIVYEQAIRFLTDYLDGDVYYKTDYKNHNLDRAKNQLTLLDSIINQSNSMEEIVEKYS